MFFGPVGPVSPRRTESVGSSAVLLSCRPPHLLHWCARAQELPASEAPPSEDRPQGQKGEVGGKRL